MPAHNRDLMPMARLEAGKLEAAAVADELGRFLSFSCPSCHRREIARVTDDIWQCQHEDCNFMWQSH